MAPGVCVCVCVLTPPPPHQYCWLSWSNPDWVGPSKMANANILFNKRIRVGQTSTLTDSSWSYLNTDWFELVKPQHWLTRAGQTSTLTVSSWSNLNIDSLELVKPQHWPSRVGQTSTLTDSSWSNLNIDRLELVKSPSLTNLSWSNLNINRRELVKFAPPPQSRTLGAIPDSVWDKLEIT